MNICSEVIQPYIMGDSCQLVDMLKVSGYEYLFVRQERPGVSYIPFVKKGILIRVSKSL